MTMSLIHTTQLAINGDEVVTITPIYKTHNNSYIYIYQINIIHGGPLKSYTFSIHHIFGTV